MNKRLNLDDLTVSEQAEEQLEEERVLLVLNYNGNRGMVTLCSPEFALGIKEEFQTREQGEVTIVTEDLSLDKVIDARDELKNSPIAVRIDDDLKMVKVLFPEELQDLEELLEED